MSSKTLLKYHGGKARIASQIIAQFPSHETYVEPYGGGAAVLLAKPRSQEETYNDLDSEVWNFLRVVRDETAELIRRIRFTPWSRQELAHADEVLKNTTECIDPVERARLFYVRSWVSRSANRDGAVSFRYCIRPDRPKGLHSDLHNTSMIEASADRLCSVQLENDDALFVMERYDYAGALFYVDPPYVHATRHVRNRYRFELSDDDHVRMCGVLRGLSGMVVLSGYQNPLYEAQLEAHGWNRLDFMAQTNSEAGRLATESLWFNPAAWARRPQAGLFD